MLPSLTVVAGDEVLGDLVVTDVAPFTLDCDGQNATALAEARPCSPS